MKIKKWRPPDKWPKKANAHELRACERSSAGHPLLFAAYRESRYATLDTLSSGIFLKISGNSSIPLDFYHKSKRTNRPQPGTFNLYARLLRGIGFDFCGGGYAYQH